jgi:hypothetical protein
LVKLIDFVKILAKHNIYNTDLKPENIILVSEFYFYIRLIDVGLSSFDFKKINSYTPGNLR